MSQARRTDHGIHVLIQEKFGSPNKYMPTKLPLDSTSTLWGSCWIHGTPKVEVELMGLLEIEQFACSWLAHVNSEHKFRQDSS
jgi:hypothetical protein